MRSDNHAKTTEKLQEMIRSSADLSGNVEDIAGSREAVLMTFVIHRVAIISFEVPFQIPWKSILIAVASVFLVVFATMIYARGKLSKDNPIDALKLETL